MENENINQEANNSPSEKPRNPERNRNYSKYNTNRRPNPNQLEKKPSEITDEAQPVIVKNANNNNPNRRQNTKPIENKVVAQTNEQPIIKNKAVAPDKSKTLNSEDAQPLAKKKEFKPNPNQNKPRQNDDLSIISVVIPLLNEEESLPELALQLEAQLNKVAQNRWEVIFIDDGSTDGSFAILKQIHDRNKKFKVIRFRRNFGKSAALAVGFEQARGVLIITMDADLQDDPSEIPNLIAKLKEGYDLVSGWKKVRKDPLGKVLPSKFFNFVTSLASGIKLHDFNCGLKGYRKDVVKSLQVYGEMHRYLPALAHQMGFRVTELPVKHHERKFGKSKFGFSRFFKGFLDLLTVMFTTRYMKRPLHLFGTLGTLFLIAGLAIDGYLTAEWFMHLTSLSNRPLVWFGIALIIVGVQSISMGLIGEMIVKNSVSNANYNVRDRLF
ncbi:MAG: glycosyltransferase family 2 protein [Candidatus Kapabacteria bacterium]|nr:glycosyltransferase family 2 protein [Candidatus Kapabacteria bacterium]